ncbi:MAG TPA: glycosyltransferase family 61 protein [Candidatus Saccharimonadales bacterium]|nr:glycosyltransferase family 61 protein [Candidatus Saccharimonadales bacterium]
MSIFKNFCILVYVIFSFSSIFAAYDVPILRDELQMISIESLLKKYGNSISYATFKGPTRFNYKPLPFSKWPENQPYTGTFAETFVLTIPDGRVCSYPGYVIIDEKYMLREFFEQCQWLMFALNLINEFSPSFTKVRKVSGRVAVITRRGTEFYSHFLGDVLGRLAILESMGIDYDYIYLPYDKPFIKDILKAWGIDPLKIIQPEGDFSCIQADELIVPSYSARLAPTPGETFQGLTILCGTYWPAWLIKYHRNKFLPLVAHRPNKHKFSTKIFISRKDGSSRVGRQILNEDQVFALLKAHGFERYELSKLSFLEQVELFHNAEVVIGAHGTGLTNILFCKPNTKVIEIFQARCDTSFYYLGQGVGVDYTCIQTMEFSEHDKGGGASTEIPLHIIQDIIDNLKNN